MSKEISEAYSHEDRKSKMNDFISAMLVETLIPLGCIAIIIIMTRFTQNIFNFFNVLGLVVILVVLYFGITQGIYADIPSYLNKEYRTVEGRPLNLQIKNYSDRYGEHTDFEFTIDSNSFNISKTEVNIRKDKIYEIKFLPHSKMIMEIIEK
ncbi:hypothetical protein [Paenibacillus sp. CGMCC 1.18879]|uniref:hypothetical protein n=1 Tax=Paenibacillus sp. CGMCC 1.18879 TaxID=2834466 RepID=UPI001CA9C711|nr:hypothetical protein [Paenibacillus sp. CGMCC 1.18879]MBY9078844.1 hypothetical protein [Paenibacillus sp. CGMCC 1.18879]